MQWSASFVIFIHHEIFNMLHLLPPEKKQTNTKAQTHTTDVPQLLTVSNNGINIFKAVSKNQETNIEKINVVTINI